MSSVCTTTLGMSMLEFYTKNRTGKGVGTKSQGSAASPSVTGDRVELSSSVTMKVSTSSIATTAKTLMNSRFGGGSVSAMGGQFPAGTQYETLPGYRLAPNEYRVTKADPPAMSDEEFEKAIREIARSHAASGQPITQVSEDLKELAIQYVSVVSPDREGLAMANSSLRIPMHAGTNVAIMHNEKGEHIGTYTSGRGWTNRFTSEEFERNRQFGEIYQNAYNSAKDELARGTSESDAALQE
ncbi:MAG: hypothetical protein LIQ30_06345 [Planctomycetes bacterium]|nr:hypothetical protein [Planctomycetota bacterium]MCD7896998.1 hypothetical protein [Planctomycetaceae bacterium]